MKYLSILFVCFVLAACGGNTQEPAPETATPGALVDMTPEEYESIVKRYNDQGKAVLVNVWATWCGPCVEEFPHIVEVQNKYKDQLQVVFISADFPEEREKAVDFLTEQGVDFETYFKTGGDEVFINSIELDWTGALPFTKIYSKNGEVTAYWEDKADLETFEQAVLVAINSQTLNN